MTQDPPSLFEVYHWIIPATTCDYPVLAVAQDRSALLSLGNYSLGFDWGIPEEAQPWLEQDFAPTGQLLRCDLSLVRHLLTATFAGGAMFGIVRFNDELHPAELELGLTAQQEAEQGAEYLLHALGRYQRFYRDPERFVSVTSTERAMLDVCTAAFAELAAEHATLLRQPLPPRYRATWNIGPVLGN